MDFRNISAWSIRNPVIPIVLFVGLMLAGVVSFMRMDIQQQPDIEFPVVIVNIAQPGASPTEIETQITQRVEAAVRSISGVNTISSTASEGNSQTLVEFELGENINSSVNEVKNSVDQIRGDLPDGILEPQIYKATTTSQPIAYFAVKSDDMTLEQLSWFIDDTVAKRLLSIEGLAKVSRDGGVDREILVTLDPGRMQALGVSAAQVNSVLRQLNLNAAGGKAEIAGSRQSVRVLGNAQDAFQLSQTEIPLGAGRAIKLADIAKVTDSFGEIQNIVKFEGRQVVTFAISRARGASDVSVFDAAEDELSKLEAENPGIGFQLMFTTVPYARNQYVSSMEALVEGAILAVVVVFLFLRDWRATIIAAIAIPLSAIPTFWFMDMMGFSLNLQSLLALSLVAGVLVDDAIVEIENIVRHMRMGKTAYQAAIDAADEIGLAVVATTFSIVAVFLPVGIMPGVSGEFFRAFGLTIVVAVLMSLAVARMITPMVAAYFLKAHGEAEHGGGAMMRRYMAILHWSLDQRDAMAYRAAHRSADGHLSPGQRLKARLHDHRVWMLGVGAGALVLTGVAASLLPMEFTPTQNNDFVGVQLDMAPGTTLKQTEQTSDRIAALLKADPDSEFVFQRVMEGSGRLMVTLRDDRKKTSKQFENKLTPALQNLPDARISFVSMNSQGSGTGRDISVMLTGKDTDLLNRTAAKLVEQMRGLNLVVAPRISADMRRPEILIRPRQDLAADLGVSTASLSQAIRIATIGEIDQNAAKFSLSDRQVPIRVRLSEKDRRDISNIENLPVPTQSGGSVPLSRVADISFGSGPTQIQRYNQERRVFVGADLAPGIVKSEADAAIRELPVMKNLPTGIANKPFGSDEWQQEMLDNLATAVPSGILLVFAVLVLLYHRIISPLVNMASLSLAPLGGLIALLITGQSLSMPVFIGILMLLGIVGKNSILLIDFAIEEMANGVDKAEAIIDAGRKRAQPIIMTTVAMTAGMLPTALALNGDAAWRAPMGTMVIGGLILSTLLTLVIVPAAFSLADGFEKRVGPMLRRSILTFEPEHAEAERARHKERESQFPAE